MACIKQAVGQPESPFKDKVTFFYGRINLLEDTQMTGRRLVSASARVEPPRNLDGGLTEIVIAEHDCLHSLVYGLQWCSFLPTCISVFDCRDILSSPDSRWSPRSDIQVALAEVAANTLALKLAKLVRQCTGAPIFVVAQPCPSENFLILDPPAHAKIKFSPLLDERIGPDLYEVFVETMQTLTRKEELIFVEQPRETLTRGRFTKVSIKRTTATCSI